MIGEPGTENQEPKTENGEPTRDDLAPSGIKPDIRLKE